MKSTQFVFVRAARFLSQVLSIALSQMKRVISPLTYFVVPLTTTQPSSMNIAVPPIISVRFPATIRPTSPMTSSAPTVDKPANENGKRLYLL